MTLQMPDSIHPADLPPGYPAYLGYVDGNWATLPELKRLFPAAYLVGLTVTGGTLDADGIDVEPGNPDAVDGAVWAARKLVADPASRPIVYASIAGTPGYGMHDVIANLAARQVPLTAVRLLSAHYGSGEHVCGPATCDFISVNMDGTQWTDKHHGNSGTLVDLSTVTDSFFVKDPAGGPVIVPGMPGEWLAPPTIVRESSGRLVALGQGTSGAAYMLVMDAGSGKWTGPTRV